MLGSEAVAELRKRGCTTSIVMCSGNCTANDMSHYINGKLNFTVCMLPN